MNVCGVICEYDPFHKGHAYHLKKAREQSQADYIICVMSGSFTQRGMPALLPMHARAEMALRCGADIVLQLLSYVAQTERELIKQRQREGIEAARMNGVHLDRKAMEKPENYEEVRGLWQRGAVSGRRAAELLGVTHTTFRRWMIND